MPKQKINFSRLSPTSFEPEYALHLLVCKNFCDELFNIIVQRSFFAWVISPKDAHLRSLWATSAALEIAEDFERSNENYRFNLPFPAVCGVNEAVDLVGILSHSYNSELLKYRCEYVKYVVNCFHCLSEFDNEAKWRMSAGLQLIHHLTETGNISTFYNTKFNKGHQHNLISRSSSRAIWPNHRESSAFIYAGAIMQRGNLNYLDCIFDASTSFVFSHDELISWFSLAAAIEDAILRRFHHPFADVALIASTHLKPLDMPSCKIDERVRDWLWDQVRRRYIRKPLSRA